MSASEIKKDDPQDAVEAQPERTFVMEVMMQCAAGNLMPWFEKTLEDEAQKATDAKGPPDVDDTTLAKIADEIRRWINAENIAKIVAKHFGESHRYMAMLAIKKDKYTRLMYLVKHTAIHREMEALYVMVYGCRPYGGPYIYDEFSGTRFCATSLYHLNKHRGCTRDSTKVLLIHHQMLSGELEKARANFKGLLACHTHKLPQQYALFLLDHLEELDSTMTQLWMSLSPQFHVSKAQADRIRATVKGTCAVRKWILEGLAKIK